MKKSKIIVMALLLLVVASGLLWAWGDAPGRGKPGLRGQGYAYNDHGGGFADDPMDMWIAQVAVDRPWIWAVFGVVKFVIAAAVIIGIVFMAKKLLRGTALPISSSGRAVKIIKERYAKGEIDETAMVKMLDALK